jgi:hypothetical protein
MAKPKSPKKNGSPQEMPAAVQTISVASAEEVIAAAVASTESTKIATRRTRKQEILREPRLSPIPISLDEEIRSLAYLLSERRGFEPGHETEDWLNAEREVLDRYHQQRA